jgi:alkylated DNA repair dioxygenase AlkB
MKESGSGPAASGAAVRFDVPDADITLHPQAIAEPAASRLLRDLRIANDWQQEEILIFGRPRLVPRLVAWHGDRGARYTYSGTLHEPLPWTPALAEIRARVQELAGCEFNAVLLNLYRGGRDSMGWHSDDEPELGPDPVIASVSLGAVRRFLLRHRRRKEAKLDLELPHGSLLVMAGATQHHWVHAVPKTSAPVGERINLTFRRVAVT